jgi:hypothetical protein
MAQWTGCRECVLVRHGRYLGEPKLGLWGMWGSKSVLGSRGGFTVAGQSKWPTSGFWATGAILRGACGDLDVGRWTLDVGRFCLSFPWALLDVYVRGCVCALIYVLFCWFSQPRGCGCRTADISKCGSNKGSPKRGVPVVGPQDPYTVGFQTGM